MLKKGNVWKNDNSDSLKFNSPSRVLLANIFTFLVMVSAKQWVIIRTEL